MMWILFEPHSWHISENFKVHCPCMYPYLPFPTAIIWLTLEKTCMKPHGPGCLWTPCDMLRIPCVSGLRRGKISPGHDFKNTREQSGSRWAQTIATYEIPWNSITRESQRVPKWKTHLIIDVVRWFWPNNLRFADPRAHKTKQQLSSKETKHKTHTKKKTNGGWHRWKSN